MSRNVDRLIDSQLNKVATDFQKQRELALRAASRIAQIQPNQIQEQYVNLAKQLSSIADSQVFKTLEKTATANLRAISYIAAQSSSMISAIDRALHVINKSQERLIEAMPAIIAFSEQITSYVDRNFAAATFPKSFPGQVLEYLHGIYESSNIEAAQQNASIVEELFEEKSKNLPPSFIVRHGLIGILIALILFVYQMHETAKSEQRVMDVILRMQASIVERLEDNERRAESETEPERYCIVQRRPARLFRQPKPKSAGIGLLYPNQMTSLIKSKGKWVYVEYFDYIEGLTKNGWVLKKYLRRFERSLNLLSKNATGQNARRTLVQRGLKIDSSFSTCNRQ